MQIQALTNLCLLSCFCLYDPFRTKINVNIAIVPTLHSSERSGLCCTSFVMIFWARKINCPSMSWFDVISLDVSPEECKTSMSFIFCCPDVYGRTDNCTAYMRHCTTIIVLCLCCRSSNVAGCLNDPEIPSVCNDSTGLGAITWTPIDFSTVISLFPSRRKNWGGSRQRFSNTRYSFTMISLYNTLMFNKAAISNFLKTFLVLVRVWLF